MHSVGATFRLVFSAGVLAASSAVAAQPAVGSSVADAELATAAGPKATLLGKGRTSVVLFFRPGQDFSTSTLADFASLEKEFAGKPVYLVGVVADRFPVPEVAAAAKAAGVQMPILLDKDDGVYGKLSLVQTPVVVFVSAQNKVLACEPFARINYGHVLRARIRHALKEITDQELEEVLHPSETRGTINHAAHRQLKMGQKYMDGGNHDKALEYARKALEQDANLADAHALVGTALAAKGDCKGALAAFKQALALDKANAAALAGLPACEGKGR